MRAGRLTKRVRLAAPQTSFATEQTLEPPEPRYVWAAIDPVTPGTSDTDRAKSSYVTLRYHPDITIDTRLWYGERELVIRDVQNVEERNVELRCYCEEVIA